MSLHGELTGLALVVLAALVCGLAMTRLRQPAIVGYIFAGVLLGPSALGLVEDRDNVEVLAELGVLMLLFLVGMELSLRGFKEVWKVALGAMVLQVCVGVGLTLLLSLVLGWHFGTAVILGFVVALSSTAVVVKMLEQINILRQPVGRLTIGVLIAQDLAVVPMMLTVGAMADTHFSPWLLGKIALSIAVLALLIVSLSRRKRLVLPFSGVVGGHLDLRPLAGLAYCFGGAAISGLLGLSPVLGAFLAGLVIGNSTARASMIRSTRPIQAVLLMVFFLSIGLLINLNFIWEYLGTVLLLLFVVIVVKTILNIGILRLLGEPWPHAFIAGVLLAQIGEFSLVLGQTGVRANLLSEQQGQLVVAVTAFSLMFSPVWLALARRLMRVLLLSVTSWQGTVDVIWGRRARTVFHRVGDVADGVRTGAAGRAIAPATFVLHRYLQGAIALLLGWLLALRTGVARSSLFKPPPLLTGPIDETMPALPGPEPDPQQNPAERTSAANCEPEPTSAPSKKPPPKKGNPSARKPRAKTKGKKTNA